MKVVNLVDVSILLSSWYKRDSQNWHTVQIKILPVSTYMHIKERKSSWKSWRNERNSFYKMTKRTITKPKKKIYFQRNNFWQGQFSKNNDETNEIDGFLMWLNFFHVLPPLKTFFQPQISMTKRTMTNKWPKIEWRNER